MRFSIKDNGKDPIYKQLIWQVENAIRDGELKPEEQLPSMNELASRLGISRETAKKAYGILTDKGIIIPRQGRGFYAADINASTRPQVLVIFDKYSVYKQIMYNAFAERLGTSAEITILNHNQSLDLFGYYLDNNLDRFDYYVVTPHFPLDKESRSHAVKLISRIPNRKLILLDRLTPGFSGHFGAVYQDFENDIYSGLSEGLGLRPRVNMLRVLTLPTSLYGPEICKGVRRFTSDKGIPVEFLTAVPEEIHKDDVFLILNSQLDAGLVDLARKIQASGMETGKDVSIISYNEFDMNELVLGGLTTVSTDFKEMGRLAAEMILGKTLTQVHCTFRMNRRHTF